MSRSTALVCHVTAALEGHHKKVQGSIHIMLDKKKTTCICVRKCDAPCLVSSGFLMLLRGKIHYIMPDKTLTVNVLGENVVHAW